MRELRDNFDEASNVMLSSDGLKRRGEILQLAQAAGKRRRIRRHVVRGVVIGCPLLLLALAAYLLMYPRPIEVKPVIVKDVTHVAPTPAQVVTSVIPIIHIQTEAGISARLAVHPQMTNVQWLNDAQLLQQLADSGKAGGLVYVDNTPMLIMPDELSLH
ncbi:MAG TPA: hypothetical protein VH370_18580 [Humisphaera sp.]|nr:hypothetical protein [Humisphaera sp.]